MKERQAEMEKFAKNDAPELIKEITKLNADTQADLIEANAQAKEAMALMEKKTFRRDGTVLPQHDNRGELARHGDHAAVMANLPEDEFVEMEGAKFFTAQTAAKYIPGKTWNPLLALQRSIEETKDKNVVAMQNDSKAQAIVGKFVVKITVVNQINVTIEGLQRDFRIITEVVVLVRTVTKIVYEAEQFDKQCCEPDGACNSCGCWTGETYCTKGTNANDAE